MAGMAFHHLLAVLAIALALCVYVSSGAPAATSQGQTRLLAHVPLSQSSPADASRNAISNQVETSKSEKYPKTSTICSKAPTSPGDRRSNKDELTVANFNAEWLYINGGTGSFRCPGRSCPWKNRQMALQHFNHVAVAISEMNLPDVIHLSEVEGCDALDVLIDALEKNHGVGSGLYRGYLVPGRDTALGQNVGFLTKVDPFEDVIRTDDRVLYPISGSTCGFSPPGAPARLYGVTKHYFARLEVNGIRIFLTGNHFIAYPDKPERCEKREAQASIISNNIKTHLNRNNGDEVIVLGDLNDYDEEIVDAAGAVDQPISRALRLLRGSTEPPLYNVAHHWQNLTERYSNWYDRNHNCVDDGGDEHVLIDHVLVSKGLKSRLVETYALHSYKQFCGTLNSDHWPIFARFDVRSR
ncbi:Endonuclease/exonuclease/phosphatase [Phlyctochytrium arcticum]|nr:Endonuclease/exonuclease/phosphatase [Phlyctochytrium arcticum]